MKTLMTLLLFTLLHQLSFGDEVIYIILTSSPDDLEEGITRDETDTDKIFKHPPIYFEIVSKKRRISEAFTHYNYKREELSKIRPVKVDDEMEIITKPRTFLNTITLIDLDLLFPRWDQKAAEEFGDSVECNSRFP